jgi:hypothetical protein
MKNEYFLKIVVNIANSMNLMKYSLVADEDIGIDFIAINAQMDSGRRYG